MSGRSKSQRRYAWPFPELEAVCPAVPRARGGMLGRSRARGRYVRPFPGLEAIYPSPTQPRPPQNRDPVRPSPAQPSRTQGYSPEALCPVVPRDRGGMFERSQGYRWYARPFPGLEPVRPAVPQASGMFGRSIEYLRMSGRPQGYRGGMVGRSQGLRRYVRPYVPRSEAVCSAIPRA